MSVIPEMPSPDLIWGGSRFSAKLAPDLDPGIMRHG